MSAFGNRVFGEEINEKNLITAHAVNDQFGGVTVEMPLALHPIDAAVFGSVLRSSISRWRQQGKKGIWLNLPIEMVNLVEAAVKEGFWYHHAEPKYLMLIYWIPRGAHTLPANASHRVGIGAFIMNEKRELLVVQEKYGALRGKGVWKFPTGTVEEVIKQIDQAAKLGEDICAAAEREVKEETGIDAEFVEVITFRQTHKSFFEKSDLFFVCMLRPLSFDIQKQDSEIEAAQWIPFEEYAAQPYVQKHELMKFINKLWLAKIDSGYSGFSAVPATSSSSSDKRSYLYMNTRSYGAAQ